MKRNKRLFNSILTIFFVTIASMQTYSQVTISGPSCVTNGITYQYNFSGAWTAGATMNVCITGGALADSNATCRNGEPVSFLKIVWDSSSSQGTITLTSSIGEASLNTSITPQLNGGAVDLSAKLQSVNYNSVPAAINCSAASGGNCSPSYSYAWQQSVDDVNWQDSVISTSQNLTLSNQLTQTMYFRRKVTETVSGSITFSDEATVIVNAQAGYLYKNKTDEALIGRNN